MTVKTINPAELYDLSVESGSGLIVVDVREPSEYASLRTPIGFNHPLSELMRDNLGPLATLARQESIFIICRSGQRSLRACEMLQDHGYDNVVNVTGGLLAWHAAGLPVVSQEGC